MMLKERSAEDFKFCETILPKVSRTFALSIQLLPESLKEPICVAYLLCRIVDTIEDDAKLAFNDQRRLFACFNASLQQKDENSWQDFQAAASALNLGQGSDAELCSSAGAVFRSFDRFSVETKRAILPAVLKMSEGMQIYAERTHLNNRLVIEDMRDLERYCYYVAGTVGELLTNLFLLETQTHVSDKKKLYKQAVEFGLGLQLVNILKDVAKDWQRGICFIPQELLNANDLSYPDDLFEPSKRNCALALIHTIATRAKECLVEAKNYTLGWPAGEASEIRLFCALPLALAFASLDEIKEGENTLYLDRVPKISRALVQEKFARVYQSIDSNEKLAEVLE